MTQKELDKQLLDASLEGELKKVKKYTELGANVNARDEHGNTPLHLACTSLMYYETVEYLVKHNADVNAANKDGNRPLHIAAVANAGLSVGYIVKKRPNLYAKNNAGETALDLSFACGNSGSMSEILTAVNKDKARKEAKKAKKNNDPEAVR